MAIIQPPSIPPAPTTVPQRSNKSVFSAAFEAFLVWFIGNFSALSTAIDSVYNNAVEAFNNASTATSAAAAALVTANATSWVSGATVQQYAAVISPADGRTYRRLGATGSGATDPSADNSNYVALTSQPAVYLKVSDRKAPGVSGGTPGGLNNTRTLNTIDWNDIPGASLASNQVTLPAGGYEVFIRAPGYGTGAHQARLTNITDSSVSLLGSSSAAPTAVTTDSVITGRFTITAQKVFNISHYVNSVGGGAQLGTAVSGGQSEVYTEAIFKKVA